MNKDSLKIITDYLKRGWSAFPVDITIKVEKSGKMSKVPHFPNNSWKEYQTKKIPVPDIDLSWFGHNSTGIATGKISGITVIDLDSKDKTLVPSEFWKTYTVETKNGYHFYFKYNFEAKQSQEKVNSIDIRNDGGFVFAPPSEYKLPTGEKIEYKILTRVPPLDFPIEWYRKTFNQASTWREKVLSPIQEGSRNMDFTSIVGGFLNKFPQSDWETIVWKTVRDSNSLQEKPLQERELRALFLSIAKKELEKRNSGGDIKDINVEETDGELKIFITLERSVICFKIQNLVSNLLEANVLTWIKKPEGLSHEIPFYVKIRSDTNKKEWATMLKSAFDKKEDKETYPWIIILTKVNLEIEKFIKNQKRSFLLTEIKPKEVTWIYEPFIQEDQINTFFGMGSSGKTLLSLYFSTQVSEFKGLKTMFIDYENDAGSYADKMNKILKLGGKKENFVYFETGQIPMVEQVDKIKEDIKKYGIKLVIVDSASLSTGESTSDERAVVRLISALKMLKTTVILIAHQRKNNGEANPIGSIQFENQARNVWNFTGTPDIDDDSVIHICCKHTKANNTFLRKNPLGFRIQWGAEIEITEEDAIEYKETDFSLMDRIQHKLKEEGSLDYKEMATLLDKGKTVVSNYLSRGLKKGLFTKSKDGKYSLKQK